MKRRGNFKRCIFEILIWWTHTLQESIMCDHKGFIVHVKKSCPSESNEPINTVIWLKYCPDGLIDWFFAVLWRVDNSSAIITTWRRMSEWQTKKKINLPISQIFKKKCPPPPPSSYIRKEVHIGLTLIRVFFYFLWKKIKRSKGNF